MAEIIPITPPPKKDGYGVYPEAVCVERAAGGYGILNLPMTTVPMSPKGSKEESAGAVCWLVNKGVAQLPENAPWLADFKNELELSANDVQGPNGCICSCLGLGVAEDC